MNVYTHLRGMICRHVRIHIACRVKTNYLILTFTQWKGYRITTPTQNQNFRKKQKV